MKMKKVKTIEEGVEAILQDIEIVVNKPWQYLPATSEDLVDFVIFDGKKIPLFWWRYDNQIFQKKIYIFSTYLLFIIKRIAL